MHKSLLAKLLLLTYFSSVQFVAAQGINLEALAQSELKALFNASWSARRTEVQGKDAFEEIELKGTKQAPNVVLREHLSKFYKGNRYQIVELDQHRQFKRPPAAAVLREILTANKIDVDIDDEVKSLLEKQTPPPEDARDKKDYLAFGDDGRYIGSGSIKNYSSSAPKKQAIVLVRTVDDFISVANSWGKTEYHATYHDIEIWDEFWSVALIEERADFSEWIWKGSGHLEIQAKQLINEFVKNEEKEIVLLSHETQKLREKEPQKVFPAFGATILGGDYIKCKYGTICHHTANIFIHYLQTRKVIDRTPSLTLRSPEFETSLTAKGLNMSDVKNRVIEPFSVSRILSSGYFADKIDKHALHEFVIVNLKNRAFIVQSNVWKGTSVTDANGVVELTRQELKGLFENDEQLFKRLFGVDDLDFSIGHVDSYPMLGIR